MSRPTYHSPGPIARSLGSRMLAGQGDMTLTAYKAISAPQIEVNSHRLTNSGELVVSCRASAVQHMEPVEVRMDVVLLAPEFRAYAVSASMHTLGTVHWIGSGSEEILGILKIQTVHVHYFAGAETIAVRHLLEAAQSLPVAAVDRFEAAQVAHSFTPHELGTIIDAACLGMLGGACAPITRPRRCHHYSNEVFIADVSDMGITLIRALKGSQTAVHVYFDEPAQDFTDLTNRIADLVTTSSVRRTAPRT